MSNSSPLDLQVETISVDGLTEHPRNPRVGNPTKIAQSLEENGQYKPIVVQRSTGHVLAGNHTLKAARSLGWTQVSAVYVDVDDARALKILLADNKTADDSGYDDKLLLAILEDVPDLSGTGYDLADLELLQFDATSVAPIALPRNVESKEVTGTGGNGFDNVVWGFLQMGSRRVVITPVEVERLNVIHDAFLEREDSDAGFGHLLADGADGDLGIDSMELGMERLEETEIKHRAKQEKQAAKEAGRAAKRDAKQERRANLEVDGSGDGFGDTDAAAEAAGAGFEDGDREAGIFLEDVAP